MRTHIRLLLPRLHSLNLQQPLAFAVVNRRQQIQQKGEMPLEKILQTFVHLPFVCLIATGDMVMAELDLPPLKKSQLATAIRSRLQNMLLHPYTYYVVDHIPQSTTTFHVYWALKRTIQPLLELLHSASIHPIQLIPTAALARDESNPSKDWKTQALPKINLSFPLASHQQTAPIWLWFKWPILAALIWWVCLLLINQKNTQYAQQVQKENSLLVKEIFPSIPLIVSPLTQAKQALLQQQELSQTTDMTPNLALRLTQVSDLIPTLNDQVRAMHYEKNRLQLLLIEPLAQLFTPDTWQDLQDKAQTYLLSLEKDEDQPHALWVEFIDEVTHE